MLSRCYFILGAAALATAALAGSASTAQADDPRADVTGFRTTNLAISSQGCKYVPVTMAVSYAKPNTSVSLTTHIYRGGREVDTAYLQPNKSDTWFWCSWSDGFGTFRLGPTDGQVTVSDDSGSSSYAVNDGTVGYVKVKVRSAQKMRRAVRSGRYVVVTAQSSFYNYGQAAWSPWSKVRVSFQQRLPGTARWQHVGYAWTSTQGIAAAKIYAPTDRYWRTAVVEGPWAWGATPAPVWNTRGWPSRPRRVLSPHGLDAGEAGHGVGHPHTRDRELWIGGHQPRRRLFAEQRQTASRRVRSRAQAARGEDPARVLRGVRRGHRSGHQATDAVRRSRLPGGALRVPTARRKETRTPRTCGSTGGRWC